MDKYLIITSNGTKNTTNSGKEAYEIAHSLSMSDESESVQIYELVNTGRVSGIIWDSNQDTESIKRVKSRHHEPWTPEEEDHLKSMVKRNWSYSEMTKALGRTSSSISSKIHHLRSKGDITNSLKQTNSNQPRWTEEEEEQLVELYRNGQSIQNISSRLSRTVSAIHNKISRLSQHRNI